MSGAAPSQSVDRDVHVDVGVALLQHGRPLPARKHESLAEGKVFVGGNRLLQMPPEGVAAECPQQSKTYLVWNLQHLSHRCGQKSNQIAKMY